MSYNGWSNYETWCVSLWLDNDEWHYEAVRDLAREQRDAGNIYDLTENICSYVREMPEVVAVNEAPASFVTDLLGAALSEVDWHEIAENLLSEVSV